MDGDEISNTYLLRHHIHTQRTVGRTGSEILLLFLSLNLQMPLTLIIWAVSFTTHLFRVKNVKPVS